MIRFRRQSERHPVTGDDVRDVTLVVRRWSVWVGHRRWGWGACYLHPVRVEIPPAGAESVPIPDHVMLARLVGVAAPALALLTRRLRP